MKNLRRLMVLVVVSTLSSCASSPARKGEAAPVGNAALLARCEKVFDTLRPGLEKQWEVNLPMDVFQKLRDKMPELKREFSQECSRTLAPQDVACAEGDISGALEACKAQPAEFQQPCRDDAEEQRRNPLMCKPVAALLDSAGASWMKAQKLDQ